jgi:predicted XRE-type DNA-binding protein
MEQQTLLALRSDLALQIARAVGASGQTQTAAAASLQLPQPTFSRIINGRVEGLTVELLIRVAVRLRLPLSLQTGLDAREAGVFLASGPGPGPGPSPRLGQRLNPSKVADHAKLALLNSIRRRSPTERLEAFIEHNRLLAALRTAGEASRRSAEPAPRPALASKRRAPL